MPHDENSPKGVDETMTGGGKDEGNEPGRKDEGAQGQTDRPAGTSTAKDVTGVDPQDQIDPESPYLQHS